MVIARSSSSADIDFQGKHAGEDFQFQFHQHWIRLLWPFIKLAGWHVLIFSIGYLAFVVAPTTDTLFRRGTVTVLVLMFCLAHLEFLKRFYCYLLYVVVVTDKKIHRIKKSLFLIDDHQSIDLWMLQDIQKSQKGIVQNILQFGTITLEAQETVLRIHFVPHVSKKYEQLLFLRENARGKMGYAGGMSRART